ncbi:TonB-dependent receptor [Dolichospermum sp. UHCC 0259]|uniref:TonB-dependent receptor n=1 Tax=Dolichospermum sp. UHCC 0259 TaxID=2590010 RepID=UPI00144709B6|nr:TonB-dependent receptor [Dolichospermum sp. UHCC 0259]MTJ48261.1 TonB-dependent receptor [Dolichospermum sp. UHCC 0259]
MKLKLRRPGIFNLRLVTAIAGVFSFLFSHNLVKAESTTEAKPAEPPTQVGDEISGKESTNNAANSQPKITEKAEETAVPVTQLPIDTAPKTPNIPLAGSLDFNNPGKSPSPIIETTQKAENIPVAGSLDFANSTPEKTENIPVNADLKPTEKIKNAPVPDSLKPPEKVENAPVPDSLNPTKTSSEVSPTAKGVKILSPKSDDVLDNPTTTIVLQFSVGSQIELRVNGELVDPNLIGRTETDSSTNLVTQTWYGVSLKSEENTISARILGSTEPPEVVKVAIKGAPTELKLVSRATRIPADGRSTTVIQGQLLDENGNRSNQDAVITLTPTAGEFIGADFQLDQPGFQVQAKDGLFEATLRADRKAQTVRISAAATGLEGFTQLQFETALRSSLLTGVIDVRLGAKGTDYYSPYRDFLPPDQDNDTQLSFTSAIFATGSIGEWLFTGAYNSSRSLNEDCNCDTNLFGTGSSNNQNYPVYGDSSTSSLVTPSIDSVYARLERSPNIPGANPDYFMWGDYNTEELSQPSQQYTATSRQLHGFKANYNIGNLAITGFYSQYVKGFQRDTIAPDGTSGYYFLSRRILTGGSENVYLELEELNRPGTVIKRRKLSRGPDYDVDYDRGTLLFREPILRTALDEYGQILVRRIIVTYEYDAKNSDGKIYAGRLQYNLNPGADKKSWFGATYLQENQGIRDFEVYGADAQISLGGDGQIVAEYAHSRNNSELTGQVSGQAYRLDARGTLFPGLQGRTYYNTVSTGFANNATTSFSPGQTRYGAQLTGKVTNSTNLRLQYDHEDNFGIAPQPRNTFEELFTPQTQATPGSLVNNSLTTITAGIQQRFGQANLDLDWIYRDRQDRISTTSLGGSSQQLRSRFSVPIFKSLTFQAQNELSLSNQSDSVYPARTTFGLNWAAIPGVNVSLTHQLFNGSQANGNSATSLNINGEQKFGKDTTVTGRYSIIGGANEMTTQGAIGLKNQLTIAPGLRLNVAYEHVFGSFFTKNATGQQYSQPFAFGQAGSSISFNSGDSYSVGLDYTDNPSYQASAKYEYRNSGGGSNTVISAGVTGKISPSLTALARYQQANSSNQKLIGLGDTINFKLGLAYRDIGSDKFNALLRYEYRQNPATIPDTILLGSGTGSQDHTFAMETIYAPNWQWEFYGKYGIRNSTSYLASDLAGTSTVNLAQFRATYRLGYSMDVVGETRLISQGNYTETGFVLEAGYYLNANLRLAAGYAFGKVDDRDFSGTRSAGGPYLGLTLKLNELFEGFGQQKVAPQQQKESLVKGTTPGKLKI